MPSSQLTRQNSGTRCWTTAVSNPANIVVRTDSRYKPVIPRRYRCNLTSHGDSSHPMFYK
ncbi:hypothetical protein GIB67_002279 [Kingdonia uniflora]|uniref:Uncharacterized protein n=1 Tax=Kingdonia uniflora TaxID=39325 RepID=A0A7J7KX32_9MAGN|nr:hypothetical protein GIB67_002279 [Kingdonia uniflora]